MSGFEDSAGLGVNNFYGPREPENVGSYKVDGAVKERVIDIDESLIANDIQRDIVTIEAGALIINAFWDTVDVFVLGGTTPTILVGTDGSEVTNGLVITEAQAEALGNEDVTASLTGTWGAKLAAETTIGVALGGSTPVSTGDGKGRLVIQYLSQ